MFYLSLYSGACGGDLACQYLLNWKCVGYIDNDKYCQQVIAQRIKDGFLDEAPIFGDIRDFINQGYAESYKGMVEVVTAGPPCQPFSAAGKRKGEKDERDLTSAFLDTIKIVRPKYLFIEQVPRYPLFSSFETLLGGLRREGYGGKITAIPACIVAQDQVRMRLWICADRSSIGWNIRTICWPAAEKRLDISRLGETNFRERAMHAGISGTAYGVAHRMDRLKAIGNGQVPLCATVAWKILSQLA